MLIYNDQFTKLVQVTKYIVENVEVHNAISKDTKNKKAQLSDANWC